MVYFDRILFFGHHLVEVLICSSSYHLVEVICSSSYHMLEVIGLNSSKLPSDRGSLLKIIPLN